MGDFLSCLGTSTPLVHGDKRMRLHFHSENKNQLKVWLG
jgi:hypothetical protein